MRFLLELTIRSYRLIDVIKCKISKLANIAMHTG